MKSKTIAERAAWDFIGREGNGLELSVVNPVGIFGPALGPDLSGSIQIVQRLMDGALPGCPRIAFGVVDVRDVAELHLRAMIHPDARGERFLAVAGEPMALVDVARTLKEHLGAAAARAPTHQIPDWLIRLAAWRDPAARQRVPDLGVRHRASSAKARRLLRWAPRSNQEAIIAAGESLVHLDLLKNSVAS
jgi:nucleoside-diphosphate-sugar epimerase